MKKLLLCFALLCTVVANATTYVPVQLLNSTGSTSGQAVVSNGASSTPTWQSVVDSVIAGSGITVSGATGNITVSVATNGVALGQIAQQAANTVLANATGSTASVTALAVPSCSTSSSALNWTTSGGSNALSCNATINAATLGSATFAAPGPIGSTTASTGAFTTLSASSTVSGVGFSTYFASPPAIGGTAAAAGSFTTLSASSTVSGVGFSTYLASPPAIGGTAAAAGKFTTLQATSTITPSTTAGIVGTTLADSAQAGSVGEIITATTSNTSLTSGTTANAASAPLTAGDWDVQCDVFFNPAGTTTISLLQLGVNTTSATLPGTQNAQTGLAASFTNGSGSYWHTPVVQENVSVTTTVYCPVNATFGTSTMTVNGTVRARRIR